MLNEITLHFFKNCGRTNHKAKSVFEICVSDGDDVLLLRCDYSVKHLRLLRVVTAAPNAPKQDQGIDTDPLLLWSQIHRHLDS